jgi:hypothetical protein
MGVDVDLAANTASIPQPKVDKIVSYLDAVATAARSRNGKLKLKFLEEMLGLLNWISSILVSGGFHLALIVSARRAAASNGFANLTVGLAQECAWWKGVVTKWNRVSILLPPRHAPSPFSLADSPVTDAAGGADGGGGGFFGGMWTAVKWSAEEAANLDIMELEALMYCIFLKMLIDKDPGLVQGRRFVARNDNQPWVAACNSNDSTKPAIALLLAWLHELMALYSFSVELEWIKSADNPIADALSRGEVRRFLESASDAGFPPSSLVAVRMPDRSSIVSRMMLAKRSQRSMHPAQ